MERGREREEGRRQGLTVTQDEGGKDSNRRTNRTDLRKMTRGFEGSLGRLT